MAQNEMRAMRGVPLRVRLNDGLGGTVLTFCLNVAFTNLFDMRDSTN